MKIKAAQKAAFTFAYATSGVSQARHAARLVCSPGIGNTGSRSRAKLKGDGPQVVCLERNKPERARLEN
jgi:hypothetical protein